MSKQTDPEKYESSGSSQTAVDEKKETNCSVHGSGAKQPGCGGCGLKDPNSRSKESGGLVKDGKHEIDEDEYPEALGFAFPSWKKWWILTVIFAVQCSMNYNASVIGNAITEISKDYGVSVEKGRALQGGFLMAYGIGCELWAPFSEEFGRWPTLQLSLGLVNLWQIPCAVASNFGTLVVFRVFGGLSSAGGSVTLGMVADLFEADQQQYAVLYVVLASVGGSVLGPIGGGFIEQYLSQSTADNYGGWRWNFWIQLLFGVVVQAIHFFGVPETRATVMLDKKAKSLRKENKEKYGHIYGPNEMKEKRLEGAELIKIWARPFIFFATEPIVLFLSLLSGFSDALIFTFLEAFGPVYEQWDFNYYQVGLAFVPLALGYFIAYFGFIPDIIAQKKERREKGSMNISPERRLKYLLPTAPLEAIGLFIFTFTSYGPMVLTANASWIGSMVGTFLVGVANFAIYYTTIDYMVAAYGPYSASATGGNGFARDFLAGLAAFYAGPMFGIVETNGIGKPNNLQYGSLILALLAVLVIIPVFVFYYKGEYFRRRSKYAQTLASGNDERQGRRKSSIQF